ncbi:MAG: hypothetical protein NT144_06245 [Bacteroidia bacterium]|nr:hypothetical protein [Bacteroidia bacterium]
MKKIIYIVITGTIFLLLSVCSPQKKIAGNYTYKTECMGIEMDGSQTVKAWGNGRSRADAIEQAKKNAVRDVLFNGIIEGKSDCEKRPVVSEVNAQVKYETYFNKFFTDGGEFKNYMSMKDEQLGAKDIKGARESITIGLIIRVLRPELKQKMIADGILK